MKNEMSVFILTAAFVGVIACLLLGTSTARAQSQNADGNSPDNPIFSESFDSVASMEDNNGVLSGQPVFVKGVKNDAFDFFGRKRVAYPMAGNLNLTRGTIEFWIKPPEGNGYGFFDIGLLGRANSWGIFKNVNYLIMEMKNRNNSFRQAWSPNELASDNDWHFVAAVWERQEDITYFKVSLDGQCKEKYDGVTAKSFPDPNGVFYVGWCGWYGHSESIIDELKIYDYPKTAEEIKNTYHRTFEENAPYFSWVLPEERMRIEDPNTAIDFSVGVVDPGNDAVEIEWFVNDVRMWTGDQFNYLTPHEGIYAIRVVATDGVFSAEEDWGIYIRGSDWKIFDGKLMVDGEPFSLKGVCYTPWLKGTGPDGKKHKPLPGEFDDVTKEVTYNGITWVTDYSGDGRIQMWEVVQYDMETIKGVYANSIRTYAAGEWHDKNLNGIVDRSSIVEEDEIVQGDLPYWVLDRMVDFCERNDMKLIIGYWVQEEDFKDADSKKAGRQLECNWEDLEVAKDTLSRVVDRYGNSPAVIAWGIGNEVHGSWNQYFRWAVDINEYLNRLFDYVRSIDPRKRPVMYAKYIGEDTNFRSLRADVVAPNAYILSAPELVERGEFNIPAPAGKAYLLGEYGHEIDQAEGHWNLAQEYAGGFFLEYCDLPWKGGDQARMGIVEEYRAKKPERYDVLSALYRPAPPGD